MQPERPETDVNAEPAPDASSDRMPQGEEDPQGRQSRPKKPPLPIREIEKLEDDAKGG
jgi:hypothetical protein